MKEPGRFAATEGSKNGREPAKTAQNLNNTDKMHKNGASSLGNIALAPAQEIGYNMVTKVTDDCFWLS